MKKRVTATICEHRSIATAIFRMRLHWEGAGKAVPGQFVNIYLADKTHLLPRPISIWEIDETADEIVVIYRIAGEGTKMISEMKEGSTIDLIGPLGNGFPLEDCTKKALIVGGGIGIPPMLGLARAWKGDADCVLGFRDEAFLDEAFRETGHPVYMSSDTGAVGMKGTVLDVIKAEGLDAKVIYACGPKPMLAALKNYAKEKNIQCYVSMEERMACGVGACLGCVCKSTDIDGHSLVHNKRVCKDGPVFDAREVEL